MKSEGAGLKATFLHLLTQELEEELVLVVLIRPHINYEVEVVRDHIMLGASLHNSDCHFGRT